MTDASAPEAPAAEAPAPAAPQSTLGTAPVAPAAPAEPEAPAAPANPLYPEEKPEPEAAPEGEKPAEPEAPDLAALKASYEFELPEGATVDQTSLDLFKEIAAKATLPKEVAQELVNLGLEQTKHAVEAAAQAQQAAFETTVTQWRTELAADSDFAPATRAASLATIGRALDEYGAPGVREAFELTGAGDNPLIVKTFLKMAKALTEGGPVQPKGPAAARKGFAETFYPSSNS